MSIATSFTSSPPLPFVSPEVELSSQEGEILGPTMVRLSVEQYQKMIEHGILEENNRIELLEGILVQKMTKKPAHWISAKLVSDALEELKVAGYVSSQPQAAAWWMCVAREGRGSVLRRWAWK